MPSEAGFVRLRAFCSTLQSNKSHHLATSARIYSPVFARKVVLRCDLLLRRCPLVETEPVLDL